MKIVFVADARSPIAQNWISYFSLQGHEVHVLSSYPCDIHNLKLASLTLVPRSFSQGTRARLMNSSMAGGHSSSLRNVLARQKNRVLPIVTNFGRKWLASLEVVRYAHKVHKVVTDLQPDLVHAMRIPFEGNVTAFALRRESVPLLVSVWGNDFTLQMKFNPLNAAFTRRTMQRIDALHTDCQRDLRLAYGWGFSTSKPFRVLPGAGGVQQDVFYPGPPDNTTVRMANVPEGAVVIINPRGFRGYVRNDIFFQAIPLVLKQCPSAIFLCSSMMHNTIAEQWVQDLGIASAVRLLPTVTRDEMAEYFRLSQIAISPSLHDGTPNTLLEAMASGCFPVAGDIESVREWIVDGINGSLCDPNDALSIANSIIGAIRNTPLRDAAREHNRQLVEKRAIYSAVMSEVENFYTHLVAKNKAN